MQLIETPVSIYSEDEGSWERRHCFEHAIPRARQDACLLPPCSTAAAEDKASHSVGNEGVQLGLVAANVLVVRNNEPSTLADDSKPDIVLDVISEVVCVAFNW